MTNEVKEDSSKIADPATEKAKEPEPEPEKSKNPEAEKSKNDVSPEKEKPAAADCGDVEMASTSFDEMIDFEAQRLDGTYNQIKNLMTHNEIKYVNFNPINSGTYGSLKKLYSPIYIYIYFLSDCGWNLTIIRKQVLRLRKAYSNLRVICPQP